MTDERSLSGRIWRVPEDDSALIARLVELGMIDEGHVETVTFDAGEDEKRRPRCLFVIERGWVTAHQLRRITNSLTKLIPTCYKCLKRTGFEREDFDGTFTCPKCKEEVSFGRGTAGLAEALLPHTPSRMVDSVFEQLLVKSQGLSDSQLDAIRQVRKTRVPRPTMPQLVVECVLLTEPEATKLRRKAESICRKKVAFWVKLEDDMKLAFFLLQLAVVGQVPLSKALVTQFDAAMGGDYYPLRDLMVEIGELTPSQLARWLPRAFDDEERRHELLESITALTPTFEDDDDDDLLDSDSDVDLKQIDIGGVRRDTPAPVDESFDQF